MANEKQTTIGDIRRLIDGMDEGIPVCVCDDSSFAWEFANPTPIKMAMTVRTADEADRFVLVRG